MTGRRTTRGEDTASLLHADRNGTPVPIPGAFEKRVSGPTVPARYPVIVIEHPGSTAGSKFEGLERAREGGGSPGSRAGRRSGTLGGRLWQSLLHPTDVSDIWRRVRPSDRP